MRKRRTYIRISGGAAAGLVLAAVLAAAAWSVTGRAGNVLTTDSFSNRILEKYQKPPALKPGQSVEKVVHIENDGAADSFVRVRVTPLWVTRDRKGRLTEDKSLDTGMLQVEYNTRGWMQLEDGYWYYKDVLKAGTQTEEPLIKSFWLSEQADNSYKNKDGEIRVELESIQASEEALEGLWGVSRETLGIMESPCKGCETVTRVVLGENRSLKVEAGETDLFADFKHLLPGCARTQAIKVCNQSGEAAEFFLRAEPADQGNIRAEKKAMVEKFLSEYAFVEIRLGSRVLYQGPVDGNLKENQYTMKRDIRLGALAPGAAGNLTATLSLSPEMGNEFQKLAGKVNWVFTAAGYDMESAEENTQNQGERSAEGSPGNPKAPIYRTPGADNRRTAGQAGGSTYGTSISTARISPKTGDDTEAGWEVILIGGSLCLGLFSGIWLHRKERCSRENG